LKSLKQIIKSNLDFLLQNYREAQQKIYRIRLRTMSVENIFTDIYKKNRWGGISRSGVGSDLKQTKVIRNELPKLFNDLKVTSILDIPCGDFFWLKELDLDLLSYTGADIVDDFITSNNEKYKKKNRKFVKLNILNDKLPHVDLILCRDLFIHFSFNDIWKAINAIKKSDSKYLLTTSYTQTQENRDILTGDWRPLNLLIPPFSFPQPIRIIDEKSTLKQDFGKSLLLWKIEDLKKYTNEFLKQAND